LSTNLILAETFMAVCAMFYHALNTVGALP
jgi:hypothetical protein